MCITKKKENLPKVLFKGETKLKDRNLNTFTLYFFDEYNVKTLKISIYQCSKLIALIVLHS